MSEWRERDAGDNLAPLEEANVEEVLEGPKSSEMFDQDWNVLNSLFEAEMVPT